MKKCPRCKIRIANSKDHKIPVVLGKMCDKYKVRCLWQSKNNIVMVCRDCNSSRGHRLLGRIGMGYINKLFQLQEKGLIYLTSREIQILRTMKNKLVVAPPPETL